MGSGAEDRFVQQLIHEKEAAEERARTLALDVARLHLRVLILQGERDEAVALNTARELEHIEAMARVAVLEGDLTAALDRARAMEQSLAQDLRQTRELRDEFTEGVVGVRAMARVNLPLDKPGMEDNN